MLYVVADEIDSKELGPNLKEWSGYGTGYERLNAILESLKTLKDIRVQIKKNSTKASLEELATVHCKDYIEWLSKAWKLAQASEDEDWYCSVTETLKVSMHMIKLPLAYRTGPSAYKAAGYYTMDATTAIFEHTYSHACISGRTSIETARLLKKEKNVFRAYSLTCHPGHHAKSNQYEGYSFFNNAALLIHQFVDEYKKIAVLDLDVHAGNGTQEIFYSSNRILTISIHSDPSIEYPHRDGFAGEDGENEGKGFNLNLVFSKKISSVSYFALVQSAMKRMDQYQPDLLVIPFGADTYRGDVEVNSLAGANLELDDYLILGSMISTSFGKKPILVTQEGGYCIEKVGQIVCNFLQGLCLYE
jgi:acetoin utilization deacetylase AcuC-like enzyme